MCVFVHVHVRVCVFVHVHVCVHVCVCVYARVHAMGRRVVAVGDEAEGEECRKREAKGGTCWRNPGLRL